MIEPISLRLLNRQGKFALDLSPYLDRWERSIRLQGGFWIGSLQMEGDTTQLSDLHYSILGWEIEERAGGETTWEGIIYEMDLAAAGGTRRLSLDYLANAVKAAYIDESNVAGETGWATDDRSIGLYGRKEEIITLDNASTTNAEALRDAYLLQNAWPWPRPVRVGGRQGPAALTIRACGWVFTANWRYTTTDDGGTGPISDWIRSIVATDCEFISEGKIESNSLQIKRALSVPTRAWDLMLQLAELGDGSWPWRIWVDVGRRLYYRRLDTSPSYLLREDGIHDLGGGHQAVLPYRARPGILRDAVYPVRRGGPANPFLQDGRDLLIEEVQVRGGELILKPADFDPLEVAL